jgi:hypothetical protein
VPTTTANQEDTADLESPEGKIITGSQTCFIDCDIITEKKDATIKQDLALDSNNESKGISNIIIDKGKCVKTVHLFHCSVPQNDCTCKRGQDPSIL